ncbi:transmembrane protein 14A [Hyperolius riggenbachi]|uniref:transmembrane protein 14A n=1 Tax=Hyperolius riggenbachi TaxID=752182 RepID=UPI0035A3C1CC
MALDWIGFGYAGLLALGGFMGFSRKGSIVSLIAGLSFGLLAAYGAMRVSYDPSDIKISLIAAGSLSVIMGVRYNHSRKFIPAGAVAGISISMVIRLLLLSAS